MDWWIIKTVPQPVPPPFRSFLSKLNCGVLIMLRASNLASLHKSDCKKYRDIGLVKAAYKTILVLDNPEEVQLPSIAENVWEH